MLSEIELAARQSALERACQQANIKLTYQRLEVLREVARSEGHPSAEAILRGVRQRVRSVSLDTVYRTLWLLTDLGLIATLGPRREVVRFDPNLNPHHHYHCVRCDEIIDVEDLDLEELKLGDRLKPLGTVASVTLEVHGICRRCAQRDAGQNGDSARSQLAG